MADVALVAAARPVEAEALRLRPLSRPRRSTAAASRRGWCARAPPRAPTRARTRPAREVVDARPEAAVGLEQARRGGGARAAGGREQAAEVADRASAARGRTPSAPGRAAPAGARDVVRERLPDSRSTTAPSSWNAMLQYFVCVSGGITMRTAAGRGSTSAIEPNGSDAGSSVGCSPCMPLVCISRRRSVTSSTGPNGFVIAAASGTCRTSGSSSRSRPRRAAAGSTTGGEGLRDRRDAVQRLRVGPATGVAVGEPVAVRPGERPSRTTPTAAPGSRFSVTNGP